MLSYPKPRLRFELIDADKHRIVYTSELECTITYEFVDRRGISDFRVFGGLCPEGDLGEDAEICDLIHRTEAPEDTRELVRQFAIWLALRKRVPF